MARLRLSLIASDTAPPANQVSLYAKTDKKLYYQDDTGTEYLIATGGGGGGAAYNVEYFAIDAGEAAAKAVTLSGTPTAPTAVLFDVIDGGSAQVYSLDFTVSGNIVSWAGGRLDGILAEADELRIVWY